MNAGAGAAAAAAAQHMLQEEEETMTSYSTSDLSDDWEFKILRSITGTFKHREKMRQVLDEEAQAGWVLVEKFDDGRIRVKRPVDAREHDHQLTFDPYRTTVGISSNRIGIMAVVIAVTIAAVTMGAVILVKFAND